MPTPYTHPTDIPPLLLGYLAGMVIHESIVAVREGRLDDATEGYVVADALQGLTPPLTDGVGDLNDEVTRMGMLIARTTGEAPVAPWPPTEDTVTKILTLANHL